MQGSKPTGKESNVFGHSTRAEFVVVIAAISRSAMFQPVGSQVGMSLARGRELGSQTLRQ
jgi:hypothetical protein